MKKTLSLILSILILAGTFSGLGISASAYTVNDGISVTDYDGGDNSPLFETSAYIDPAPTGHYDIAVGRTTVTESNYRDVLGDGTVRYDPSTNTLTLDDPHVNTVNGDEYGVITINRDGVTVKGSFTMTGALSGYGLYAARSVTLDGNFTFIGSQNGIFAHTLTVKKGTIKSVSTDTGETCCGIYCDDMTIMDSVTRLEMKGKEYSFIGDPVNFNNTRITSPVDAFYSQDARTIIKGDYSGISDYAVIEPFSGVYYDLWLGSRRVTSENCNDIYGDGKAVYDPSSKTLILDDPSITGAYSFSNDLDNSYKIFAEDDLTVKGSYHMTDNDVNFIHDPTLVEDKDDLHAGIYTRGSLVLDGDFTFMANDHPVTAKSDVTLKSGSIYVPKTKYYAVYAENGTLAINTGVLSVDVSSDVYPLYASTIDFGRYELITTPSNGAVAKDSHSNFDLVYDLDTQKAAKHVVIEYVEDYKEYDLILGEKRVNSLNRKDIFGDGKASFNPLTNTLTLDDPQIIGTYENNGNTYKIFTKYDLTVEGSCTMTSSEAKIGLFSSRSLVLKGDFDIKGTDYAVYAGGEAGITLSYGTLNAQSSGYSSVVAINGGFCIEDTAEKADIQGGTLSVLANSITLGDGIGITEPENGTVAELSGYDLYTVVEPGQSGAVTVNHAVFEKKSVEPTSVTPTEPSTDESYPTEPTGPTEPVEDPGKAYDVWLGNTQVKESNKNDILADGGSARFDPKTNVLILSDPDIPGIHEYDNGYLSSKIYSAVDITVKGSYHMTSTESVYAISVRSHSLTLEGDFTLKGSDCGIFVDGNVILNSGTLDARGGRFAVAAGNTLEFGVNFKKLDAYGDNTAFGALVISNPPKIYQGALITVPQGGSFVKNQGNTYYVAESGGSAALHVVIENSKKLDLDGDGSEDLPYLIKSEIDWNYLSEYIKDGGDTGNLDFRLDNNITVTKTLGISSNPFKGNFDGYGHILTLDIESDDDYCAPFSYVGKPQIRDLLVNGSIRCSDKGSALIGRITGSGTIIKNCVVSADIVCTGDVCGGFVGYTGLLNVSLWDCVFNGNISSNNAGTFVGSTTYGIFILERCLDISDSDFPVGSGIAMVVFPYNVYHTNKSKDNGDGLWIGSSKPAYTVTCEDEGFTLYGDTGLIYGGVVYAAEDDELVFGVSDIEEPYAASAGTLGRLKDDLTLLMPSENVDITKLDSLTLSDYGFVSGTPGKKTEGPENMLDNDTSTKWCITEVSFPVSLTFRTPKPVNPCGYILYTANDTANHNSRNPVSWKLECSVDGNEWITISQVTDNDTIGAFNFRPYTFPLSHSISEKYNCFRFTVDKIVSGDIFQLSGIKLFASGVETYEEYDVWIGSTRVNSFNRNDILSDGNKASFDPKTGVLTLNDPVILNSYGKDGQTNRIHASGVDLTVSGSYHMDNAGVNNGIYVDKGSLTLDGDFTFRGQDRGSAVYADKDITLKSGHIKALGEGECSGIKTCGKLTLSNDFGSLEASSSDKAVIWNTGHDFGLCSISTPKDGYPGDHYVHEENGDISKHVIIDQSITYYGVWVGNKQVTSVNKDDILCDGGKAKYDPDSRVLTLDDPAIKSVYSKNGETYKIYSEKWLSVQGSWHISSDDKADFGIYSKRQLDLRGSFSVYAKRYGVYSPDSVHIYSGDVLCSAGESGIFSDSAFIVDDSVSRIEAYGNEAIRTWMYDLPDDMEITIPVGAKIKQVDEYGSRYMIFKSQYNIPADHVVIEHSGKRAYPIFIGSVQVTSDNMDDILSDGGSAVFDPEKQTLSLSDPDIKGVHTDSDNNTYKIYCEDVDLTVKGSCNLGQSNAHYGIYGSDCLNFDGDFLFSGEKSAVKAENDISFISGTLSAHSKNSTSISGGRIKIEDGFRCVESDNGVTGYGGIDMSSRFRIITPSDGVIGQNNSICMPDGVTKADNVVISYYYYDLWLGDTQVTEDNRDDILCDGGSARFIPETGTLILDDPIINGSKKLYTYDKTNKILSSGIDLTVKGRYHMSESDIDSVEVGLTTNGRKLILDGDFTFYAGDLAVTAGDMYIRYGHVKAYARTGAALNCRNALYIENNAVKVDAQTRESGSLPCVAGYGIFIGNKLHIKTPDGGILGKKPNGFDAFFESDGTTLAEHVVLEREDFESYDLWLGMTQVNELNKDDILRDGGKAKYDPETATLTLDEPDIFGKYVRSGAMSYKIYSQFELNVKGSYNMSEASSDFAVRVIKKLTLDGNFTFIGDYSGVMCGDLEIVSGTLTAKGTTYGIDAWKFTVGDDVKRIEANTVYTGLTFTADEVIMSDEFAVTLPVGGSIAKCKGSDRLSIYEAGGMDYADHIMIEKVHTVSFDMQGHGKQISPQTVLDGETVTRPIDPKEEGYTFSGWFTDRQYRNAFDFSTKITNDLHLYAKWSIDEYTVSFDPGEGSGSMKSVKVKHGEKYVLPDCGFSAPNGKTFDCWDKGKAGDTVTVTSDTVIKALYKDRILLYILGDADINGKCDIVDVSVIQQKLVKLPVEKFNEDAADVDHDKKLSIVDATLIQQKLAVLPVPYAIGEPVYAD